MYKQTKKLTVISSCILILLGIVATPKITSADELTVSGNGANSNNTVNVSSSQQTTTQQTNTSQTTNNVATSVNTGNNTVSNSTGYAAVKTGDASVTTTVSNTGNASTVNVGCDCGQNTTATVTGNGNGSTNTVNITSSSNTAISVDQTADITNKISQKAVTGNNTVNNNNGSVLVKTGNITAQTDIENGPINIANVFVPSGKNGSFVIKIAGNGSNSINTVNANEINTSLITVANSASIINKLKEKYITGNNSVSYNNGNVVIQTGNIESLTNIANGPINVSAITVSCTCEKEHNKSTPPPAPTPTQPASNTVPTSSSTSTSNSSSGGSSGGAGSVLGASASNLPVTGGSYWFFIAFIGNILMMLLGGFLRLRSGRSPGVISHV